jgi:RES domain-containing protein
VAAVAAARRRTIDGRFWHQGPTRRALDACADPAVTDGRFHRAGGVGVWYASSQEQAAWAELFRHFVDDGVDPFEVIRRVGSVDVTDLVVLDLTDSTVCVALGVTEDDLVADDYTLCQDIAAAAHAAGFDGILAPAAALPGRNARYLRDGNAQGGPGGVACAPTAAANGRSVGRHSSAPRCSHRRPSTVLGHRQWWKRGGPATPSTLKAAPIGSDSASDKKKAYRTKAGKALSDADVETLARQVEGDVETLEARRRGRPSMGSAASDVVPVRLDPELKEAVEACAEREETTTSEIIREGLGSATRGVERAL